MYILELAVLSLPSTHWGFSPLWGDIHRDILIRTLPRRKALEHLLRALLIAAWGFRGPAGGEWKSSRSREKLRAAAIHQLVWKYFNIYKIIAATLVFTS